MCSVCDGRVESVGRRTSGRACKEKEEEREREGEREGGDGAEDAHGHGVDNESKKR